MSFYICLLNLWIRTYWNENQVDAAQLRSNALILFQTTLSRLPGLFELSDSLVFSLRLVYFGKTRRSRETQMTFPEFLHSFHYHHLVKLWMSPSARFSLPFFQHERGLYLQFWEWRVKIKVGIDRRIFNMCLSANELIPEDNNTNIDWRLDMEVPLWLIGVTSESQPATSQ